MPAVLVELGFLSNPREEKMLASKEGQLKLANHLFEGFRQYKAHYDAVDESITNGVIENQVNSLNQELPKVVQDGVVYKVQISTSSTKIETNPSNFKGLNGVDVYLSGKFYKYTYGNCKRFSEAKLILKQVNELGFTTAFVTAFEDGNRINLQEAIKKTDKVD